MGSGGGRINSRVGTAPKSMTLSIMPCSAGVIAPVRSPSAARFLNSSRAMNNPLPGPLRASRSAWGTIQRLCSSQLPTTSTGASSRVVSSNNPANAASAR